jgi:hypothetical protein
MRPSSASSLESNSESNPPTSSQFTVPYSAVQIRYSSSGDFVRCTLEDFDKGRQLPLPIANGIHVSESTKRDGPAKETGETEGKESDGPQILGRYSPGAASQDVDFQQEDESPRICPAVGSRGRKITTRPPNPYKLVDPSDYYQFMDDLKSSSATETGLSNLRSSQHLQIALRNRLEPKQPKGQNVLERLATFLQPVGHLPPPQPQTNWPTNPAFAQLFIPRYTNIKLPCFPYYAPDSLQASWSSLYQMTGSHTDFYPLHLLIIRHHIELLLWRYALTADRRKYWLTPPLRGHGTNVFEVLLRSLGCTKIERTPPTADLSPDRSSTITFELGVTSRETLRASGCVESKVWDAATTSGEKYYGFDRQKHETALEALYLAWEKLEGRTRQGITQSQGADLSKRSSLPGLFPPLWVLRPMPHLTISAPEISPDQRSTKKFVVKLPPLITPKATFTSAGVSQPTNSALQRQDEAFNGPPVGDFFAPVPTHLELPPPLLAPEKSDALGLKDKETWLISF